MNTKNSFDYFANRECPYYPCHEKASSEHFNCGGIFSYTENGVKDCSACLLPHDKGGYDYILKNFNRIVELVKKG